MDDNDEKKGQNFHGNVGVVVGGDAHIHNPESFNVWNMSLSDLYFHRRRTSALLWKARRKMLFSPTMLFVAAVGVGVIYLLFTLTIFKIIQQYQYASLVIPLMMGITGFMFQRKLKTFGSLFYTYKHDLDLLDSAIEHHKLSR